MEKTALIIGVIVCASRMIRVMSNIVFERLYEKYQSKIGITLHISLAFSMGMLLFGSLIPSIVVKIVIMAIGYSIILFVRDPFKLYTQDVLFAIIPKEQHQTMLTILSMGVKIATSGMGLVFSAVLLSYSMVAIITIMFVISSVEILFGLMLYKAILKGKAMDKTADII